MTERPTPLVDAKQLHCVEDSSEYYFVPADFARTLERDRSELMEALREVLSDFTTPEETWAIGTPITNARALLARLEK